MRGLYQTDIETIMAKALESEGIVCVSQFPIRSKYGYIADYAIPEIKLIIECDGEAWHPIGNVHDSKRDGFLKSIGWTVIRFRGNFIKNNVEECINKIKLNIEKLKGGIAE